MYLKWALIFDGPHTDADGDYGDEHEGNEHEDPGVVSLLQIVAREQLKHQQQEMQARTDDHRLVLDVAVTLDPEKYRGPLRFYFTVSLNYNVCNSVWLMGFLHILLA